MTRSFPSSAATRATYLILGAGPAGLTMAKMLQDRGVTGVKVLEASDKVGGKCLSSEFGDHVVEFWHWKILLSGT